MWNSYIVFLSLLGCPQSQPHTLSSWLHGSKGSYGPKRKTGYVWGYPCFSHWWLQQKDCCSFYNAYKKQPCHLWRCFQVIAIIIIVDIKESAYTWLPFMIEYKTYNNCWTSTVYCYELITVKFEKFCTK